MHACCRSDSRPARPSDRLAKHAACPPALRPPRPAPVHAVTAAGDAANFRMIDARFLGHCKPGVRIVNVARGTRAALRCAAPCCAVLWAALRRAGGGGGTPAPAAPRQPRARLPECWLGCHALPSLPCVLPPCAPLCCAALTCAGGLLDYEAVKEALFTGHVAALGLDVQARRPACLPAAVPGLACVGGASSCGAGKPGSPQ